MPDWITQLVGYAGVLAAGYAAIRADLAALNVKAERALEAADSAHRRIDSLHARGAAQ